MRPAILGGALLALLPTLAGAQDHHARFEAAYERLHGLMVDLAIACLPDLEADRPAEVWSPQMRAFARCSMERHVEAGTAEAFLRSVEIPQHRTFSSLDELFAFVDGQPAGPENMGAVYQDCSPDDDGPDAPLLAFMHAHEERIQALCTKDATF